MSEKGRRREVNKYRLESFMGSFISGILVYCSALRQKSSKEKVQRQTGTKNGKEGSAKDKPG